MKSAVDVQYVTGSAMGLPVEAAAEFETYGRDVSARQLRHTPAFACLAGISSCFRYGIVAFELLVELVRAACPAVHDPALHIGVTSSGPRDGVPLALTSPVSDVDGAHPNTVERDSPLRDPQPGPSNAQPEPAHPGTLLTVPAHYLLMQRGGLHPAPRQISSVHLNTMFQFKAASLGQTYLSSGGARAGDLIVSCPLSDFTAIYSHWRLIVWHNGYGCY
ncbi:hypothetical protein NUW54_g1153 [Trametes sanguinea]|uniref:Uncharacterized protein n=1 Tax=Trametes sanguinea TaxID=158606 RepID=A0ACC1QAB7_9APHY|nr:hypothetical protein NUW54_g1153 [Trametes sanguinea]